MYNIVKYKDRDEWLEGRKLGIGSSDAGTILGLNHYSSPLRLWRKRTGRTPVEVESAAMSRGHRLEPVVANDFAAATGAIIDNSTADDWHAVDTEKPFLRISPDRLWWPKDTPESERTIANALILECKTCKRDITPETVFNEFPYWYAQVQYQMGVMGHKRCALAWINTGDSDMPFNWMYVNFDSTYYNDIMLPKLEHFWTVNIQQDIEPEETIDADDAILRWRKAKEESSVVATPDMVNDIKRIKVIDAHIKALEEESEAIKVRVRVALGEKESLLLEDGKTEIATWKNCTIAGKFDSKRFKEECPEQYALYVGQPTETRRLLIKSPKSKTKAA